MNKNQSKIKLTKIRKKDSKRQQEQVINTTIVQFLPKLPQTTSRNQFYKALLDEKNNILQEVLAMFWGTDSVTTRQELLDLASEIISNYK